MISRRSVSATVQPIAGTTWVISSSGSMASRRASTVAPGRWASAATGSIGVQSGTWRSDNQLSVDDRRFYVTPSRGSEERQRLPAQTVRALVIAGLGQELAPLGQDVAKAGPRSVPRQFRGRGQHLAGTRQ